MGGSASVSCGDLLVEDKGHHHVDLVFLDGALIDANVHLLDPCSLDVAERLASPRDSLLDRIVETGGRSRADLGDFSYRHVILLCPSLPLSLDEGEQIRVDLILMR